MSRILWHSVSPWAGSGYGQQTRTFAPRIRSLGHDLAISAFWGLGGSVIGWEGMTVFPGDDNFGNRNLPLWAEAHKADLVITLMDVWVLTSKKLEKLPLACWVPVDHEPAPPQVAEFFERTKATPIAMSRFGERMLSDAGLEPLYVPHGVETGAFRPRPEAGRRMREQLGIPRDGFLVGMVANNQGNMPPRKAFPQVLQAFAKLREQHDDAYLFLHTESTGASVVKQGVNLGHIAELCGIPKGAVASTDPMRYELGLQPEEMAALYSAFDVLANPSYGEGFGVPIIESLACGTPVVLTDCTSMTELCGAGWLVKGEPWYDPHQKAFYTIPSVQGIYEAFEAAYEQRGRGPSEKAREFALAYDAELVLSEYWVPALEKLGVAPALKAAA